MAAVTWSLLAIDKTREAFAKVNQNLRNAQAQTDKFNKKLAGGIIGGSVFALLTSEVRHLVDEIDKIPGIPEETRQSIRDMNTAFAESRAMIDGVIASVLSTVAQGVKSIGSTMATIDWWAVLHPMLLIASVIKGQKSVYESLDEETRKYLETLRKKHAEEEAAKKLARERQMGAERDNASFKETETRIKELTEQNKKWNESQQEQADAAAAVTQSQRELEAALDAGLDAVADKWISAGSPMVQYRIDLAEVEKAHNAGKLTADEYANALAELERRLNGINDDAMKNTEDLLRRGGKVLGGDFGGDAAETAMAGFQVAKDRDLDDTRIWKEETTRIVGMAADDISRSMVDAMKGIDGAWRNLADTIISEIARVMIQLAIVNPLIRGIGSFIGFGAMASYGLPGKAVGGPVSAGASYIVGEHGPELFQPRESGRIVPNGIAGGSGGGAPTIQITQNFQTGMTQREFASAVPSIIEMTKAAVADGVRRGGGYRGAFA